MVIFRSQAIAQDERGNTERVPPTSDLLPFMVNGQVAVAAAGKHHHRGTAGTVRSDGVNIKCRDVFGLITFRTGSITGPQPNPLRRLAPSLGSNRRDRQKKYNENGETSHGAAIVSKARAGMAYRPYNEEAMRWLLVALLAATAFAQENPVDQAIEALQRNDFAAAVPLLQAASEAESENASIQFNLGFALSQLGQDDAAVAAYLKALEIEPDLPQAFLNVGVLLVRVNRATEAVPYLARAVKRRDDDPQIQYFYAHALAESGKPEEAIPVYERAGEMDPRASSIWVELGQAQAQLNRIDDAMGSFRKAAAIDPEMGSYQLQLAERIEQDGGHERALGLYRAYLADDPTYVAVRERIGMLLLEMERYEEAAEVLEQVVSQSPTDAARMALAHAYDSANNADAARAKWGEAVEANPSEPALRLRYAASLIMALEYEAAGEQYLTAVKLDDQNPTAWAGLAFALHQVKNYEACLQALANSDALEPLNPASVYLRALAQDRLGLYPDAKASYEAFLEASAGMDDEEWKSRQRLRIIELVLSRQ